MLGREAASERRSREMSTCLHLRFAPKMWSGVTCNRYLRLHLEGLEDSVSLRSTKIIECVYVSPAAIERANLFTLYLSGYEERF